MGKKRKNPDRCLYEKAKYSSFSKNRRDGRKKAKECVKEIRDYRAALEKKLDFIELQTYNYMTGPFDEYSPKIELAQNIIQMIDFSWSPHEGDQNVVKYIQSENTVCINNLEKKYPEFKECVDIWTKRTYNCLHEVFINNKANTNLTLKEAVKQYSACVVDSIKEEKILQDDRLMKYPSVNNLLKNLDSVQTAPTNAFYKFIVNKARIDTEAGKMNENIDKGVLLLATTLVSSVMSVATGYGPALVLALGGSVAALTKSASPKIEPAQQIAKTIEKAGDDIKSGGLSIIKESRLSSSAQLVDLAANPAQKLTNPQCRKETVKFFALGPTAPSTSNDPKSPTDFFVGARFGLIQNWISNKISKSGDSDAKITVKSFKSSYDSYVKQNEKEGLTISEKLTPTEDIDIIAKDSQDVDDPFDPQNPQNLELATMIVVEAIGRGVAEIIQPGSGSIDDKMYKSENYKTWVKTRIKSSQDSNTQNDEIKPSQDSNTQNDDILSKTNLNEEEFGSEILDRPQTQFNSTNTANLTEQSKEITVWKIKFLPGEDRDVGYDDPSDSDDYDDPDPSTDVN